MIPAERRRYEKNKSSKAQSYAEIRKFRNEHDLSEYWGSTRKVKFDVVLEPETIRCSVAKDLAEEIKSAARKEGVTSRTLVNRWLDQKIKERRNRRGKLTAKNL
jgi:hypothetical protein